MSLIDFLIGFFLMNAMPHFVLGVWGGRMFSIFGFGDKQNIAYGILNFLISTGLFLYQYGLDGIMANGIFTGALSILIIYLLTGHFWQKLFKEKTETSKA